MPLTGTQVTVLREFGDRVKAEPDLAIVDLMEQPETVDSLVYVASTAAGQVTFSMPLHAIIDDGIETIIDICLGRRPIAPLGHVTRIVGYFSLVRNWNKSKQAELADRRKQPHRLEGSFAAKTINMPAST